ncbi:hypothetical protein [Vogesella indigofera]|uniref:hypothetical protein n=1 Tax=Vogesella indigofera TaxID=45465 RepID=UPI00234E7E2B|nr:hypothetical protein [Vogesella indigofera]MDC7699559.1 hypothetical protein [Vogesella indigofera]
MNETTYLAYGECYQVMPRAAVPGAGWCSSMERPKSECGCPDCGPSLIDIGEGDFA